MKVYEIRHGDNGNNIIDKCSLLLHYAGPKMQSIYNSLDNIENEIPRGPLLKSMNPHLNNYEQMVAKLEIFFAPKRGPHYE